MIRAAPSPHLAVEADGAGAVATVTVDGLVKLDLRRLRKRLTGPVGWQHDPVGSSPGVPYVENPKRQNPFLRRGRLLLPAVRVAVVQRFTGAGSFRGAVGAVDPGAGSAAVGGPRRPIMPDPLLFILGLMVTIMAGMAAWSIGLMDLDDD